MGCDGLSLRNVVDFKRNLILANTSKTSTVEICWEVFSWDRPRLLVKLCASRIIWISVAKKMAPTCVCHFLYSSNFGAILGKWFTGFLAYIYIDLYCILLYCNMLKPVFHLWCFQHNVCCQSQFKSHAVSTISYCKSPLLLVKSPLSMATLLEKP